MPPLATNRCGESIMFSSCPSVSACMHPSIRACVLLAGYLTNQRAEFHKILVNCVVAGTGKQNRFWRSRVKIKVTARSNIWASYCSRRRHTHRRFGVEVSWSTSARERLLPMNRLS